jgi:hypothetical protein
VEIVLSQNHLFLKQKKQGQAVVINQLLIWAENRPPFETRGVVYIRTQAPVVFFFRRINILFHIKTTLGAPHAQPNPMRVVFE